MKVKIWIAAILVCGIFTVTSWEQLHAQNPAGSGPSLAVTMQYLQTTLGEQGKVSWATHYHDSADNTNWTYQLTFVASKMVADASVCKINYHYNIVRDGAQIADTDTWFNLRDVQDVMLTTGDQRQNRNDVAAGHTTWNATVVPPIFDLIVRGKEKSEFYFFFTDEDTANRATKALGHAVELCGGNRGSF